MSLIPIASLANGTVYTTVPFVGPQNPTGAEFLTPAAGQQVHIYAHKTTTPATVYTDEAGLSPASQPLVSGADGSVPGFIDPATLPLDLVVNGETYELPTLGSGGSGAIASVNGKTGVVVLTASDVGADASGAAATVQTALTSEVTRAEAAEALLAPLASPALTGAPTAPTPTAGDNSTKLATTGFVAANPAPLAVVTINPVSANQTLTTPASGGAVAITLTQNTTLAFSGAVAGFECNVDVQLTQDATGGRTVTWPASVTWPFQGAPPILPSGPGQTMLLSFVSFNGGTTWYGSYSTLQAGTSGTVFEPIYFGGVSSHAHTVNSLYVVRRDIPGQTTLTGLMSQNGTAVAGHVLPSLYNSAGVLIASGAATIVQAGTNIPQQYPFSAQVNVLGGVYYLGLQFDNTGQTYDAIAGSNSAVLAQGSFAAPASITPPSALQSGTLIPVMATY